MLEGNDVLPGGLIWFVKIPRSVSNVRNTPNVIDFGDAIVDTTILFVEFWKEGA